MHLSLGQAAKETGMDKSTLSRAIKSGKLSATRQENGGYAIDPAELFRVFAPAPKDTEPPGLARDTALDGWAENQALRVQLEARPSACEIRTRRYATCDTASIRKARNAASSR